MSRILTNRISIFAFVQHLNQSKFDVHKLLSNELCDKTFIIIIISLIENQIILNDGKMIKMKKNKNKLLCNHKWMVLCFLYFLNPFIFCNSITNTHWEAIELSWNISLLNWTMSHSWISSHFCHSMLFHFRCDLNFSSFHDSPFLSAIISNLIKSNVKVICCITLFYFLIQFIHDLKVSKIVWIEKITTKNIKNGLRLELALRSFIKLPNAFKSLKIYLLLEKWSFKSFIKLLMIIEKKKKNGRGRLWTINNVLGLIE